MASKNQPTGQITTTQNSAPWAPQQPYLQNVFGYAQNLYDTGGPQYFPGNEYVPFNQNQSSALGGLENLGLTQGLTNQALGTNQNLIGGQANAQNNAENTLGWLSQTNLGLTGPGSGGLLDAASRNAAYTAPGESRLGELANTNLGYNGGSAILGHLAGSNLGYNPGTAALGQYAAGDFLNGGAQNPYTQAVSQSVLSSVLPSIQSQFIQGGGLSSPEAAYASASGATTALAPTLFSNYQTQEQLQQNAANNISNAILQGGGLQAQEASGLSNAILQGGGLQEQSANNLISQILSGQSLQQQAANQSVQNALAGQGNQISAAQGQGQQYLGGLQNQIQALALAPQTQGLAYNPFQTAFNAGTQEQQNAQNQLNADIQRYNYQQTLPWQTLNQYIAQVAGNYGSSTASNQPFYQNRFANAGSGALGGALLGNLAGPALGASAGTGKGIGSILGAGLSLFGGSDRNIKADITPAGRLPNGLNLYYYRYKGDTTIHVGVMADEVEKIHPEAVVMTPWGFKAVRYDLALKAA